MLGLALAGSVVLGVIVFFGLMFLFGSFILYLVAKLFKVKKATFWNAVLAHLVGMIISVILGVTLGQIPLIGPIVSLLGIVVNIWTIKHFFQIKSWMKAFLVWLVTYVITVTIVVLVFLFIVGMGLLSLAGL